MRRRLAKAHQEIWFDLVIIAISLVVAGILIGNNSFALLLEQTKELSILGTFIAGIFFTSLLTVAPATVTIGELALGQGVLFTAFWAALGAVCGDLIIFRFIRDRFSEHLTSLLAEQGAYRRFKRLMSLKSLRWLAFLVGGLIIASPLPDEIGITILGFTKMRMRTFILLSFVFNFLAAFVVGSIAQAIV
ncbi:MAG: hypothetical protein ABA06_02320 [Parcubacteria bacterium C7867-001]|nr:MAG: hypothetical protein ABA06_02320 [Parcubacteria bacterium C7867-001]